MGVITESVFSSESLGTYRSLQTSLEDDLKEEKISLHIRASVNRLSTTLVASSLPLSVPLSRSLSSSAVRVLACAATRLIGRSGVLHTPRFEIVN